MSFGIIGHRESEVLYGKNGEQIRGSLLDFHGVLGAKTGVFQMEQDKCGEIIIKVKKNDETNNIELVREALQSKFGKTFDFKIQEVDEIELTKRGKYKMIIQRLNKK